MNRFRPRSVRFGLLVWPIVSAIPEAPVAAADRPRVIANGESLAVKDCVRAAAKAINDENLDGFVECFSAKQRSRIRRQAAMMFVRHDLALDLLDSHVVSEAGDKAEIAVRYTLTLTDTSYDIVSILSLERQDGTWQIIREKLDSTTPRGNAGASLMRCGAGNAVPTNRDAGPIRPEDNGRRRGGCASGRCGL